MSEQATIEMPARTVSVPIRSQTPVSVGLHMTTGTFKSAFGTHREMMSERPLRRPNRRRPLD